MARIELHPRKAPRQQRSLATTQTLLEAAARVLERESLAGFNTNRVAEVAGVSVGSLYQYFPNKEALVAALIQRHQDQLAQDVEAAVQAHVGRPLLQTLRALAGIAIAQQYGKPLLAAALDHEERRLPLASSLRAAEGRLGAAVAQLLKRHAAELPMRPQPVHAADLLTLTKALVEADAQAGRAPSPDLKDRIVRAQWGYLTAQLPRPATTRKR